MELGNTTCLNTGGIDRFRDNTNLIGFSLFQLKWPCASLLESALLCFRFDLLPVCHDGDLARKEGMKEGNVLFNDALNTFYLRLYGVGHIW